MIQPTDLTIQSKTTGEIRHDDDPPWGRGDGFRFYDCGQDTLFLSIYATDKPTGKRVACEGAFDVEGAKQLRAALDRFLELRGTT